jgi:hypothetical protein
MPRPLVAGTEGEPLVVPVGDQETPSKPQNDAMVS